MKRQLRTRAAAVVQALSSLRARKRLALWISAQPFLDSRTKAGLCLLLLADLGATNNKALHKYLWSNHAGYASNWNLDRFDQGVEASRRLFFADLCACLDEAPASILDVGSSIGVNLRYLEQVFPQAEVLQGLDLDGQAVRQGVIQLQRLCSRVQLMEGDMEQLDRIVGNRLYDVVFCTGVLLYLEQEDAARVVASMLHHARRIAGFATLVNPRGDNRLMPSSRLRDWDSGHIHNVDAMVEAAGGTILQRRCQVQPEPAYFVFAAPGA